MNKHADVDKNWAWVVAFAAFGSSLLNGTFCYGAGVLHVALLQHFGEDELVLVCVQTPSLCAIGFSFEKYRGMSAGIAVAGAGFGMFVSGPLVQFFLDVYGLHGSFLLMGAVSMHQVLFGVLMKPSGLEIEHKKSKKKKPNYYEDTSSNSFCCISKDNFNVFKNKTYAFFLIGTFLWNIPYSTILLHLPNISRHHGFSTHSAALLLTFVGLGSAINRILTGITQGPSGLDPLLLDVGFLGISGLVAILFPFYSSSYVGQTIFSFIFGIYSGGLIALTTPLIVDLVGLANLSMGLGFGYFIAGIGYIIGPPIAGGCFLLGSVFTLVSSIWRQESSQDRCTNDVDKNCTFRDYTVYKKGDNLSKEWTLTCLQFNTQLWKKLLLYFDLSKGLILSCLQFITQSLLFLF
ncbi:hypothetical protein KUTeg_011683 [Tegillarca granosa]|uniref:Monocarboxylate transporter n=1 Tax=Tegillarca granosa TaxID=220873 RepID=A0ABQ9EXC4_TEGGR|nr:hypothetical protein KUTeg_011683 [Tegillarca granosa]